MATKKKQLRSYTASFALRAWVEVKITAENYDAALAQARSMSDISHFVTEDDGVSVLDHYTDLVQVRDMTALNTVGG